MIFVDIDVAKNKHDCYILDSSKDMIETKFSFLNSLEGFTTFKNILSLIFRWFFQYKSRNRINWTLWQ